MQIGVLIVQPSRELIVTCASTERNTAIMSACTVLKLVGQAGVEQRVLVNVFIILERLLIVFILENVGL